MNNIQQRAFAHLTDPEGSGQRGTALNILTRRDFFTEQTVQQSEQEIHAFIEEFGPNGSGDFCDEGIDRFLDAIGLQRPIKNDAAVWLNLRFDVIRESSSIPLSEVVEKICAVVSLLNLHDQGWHLENVEAEDWGD